MQRLTCSQRVAHHSWISFHRYSSAVRPPRIAVNCSSVKDTLLRPSHCWVLQSTHQRVMLGIPMSASQRVSRGFHRLSAVVALIVPTLLHDMGTFWAVMQKELVLNRTNFSANHSPLLG